jgi:hypothetical protein
VGAFGGALEGIENGASAEKAEGPLVVDAGNREAAASPDAALESVEREA